MPNLNSVIVTNRLAVILGVLALMNVPLRAQLPSEATTFPPDTLPGTTSLARTGILPLPAVLAPADAGQSPRAAVRQGDDDDTPFLGAVVGAAVGLVAARWFVVARGCKENCDADVLLTGALGILGGGAIGYVIAGGELPEEPPPPRRRWP